MSARQRRLKKLQRPSLSEVAYIEVKNVLTSARYSPGTRIRVEELRRELGVSRTPVWDALNRLEAEGMVEIVPRRGVFLLTFSAEKARELYAVRESLEGMAARLATEHLTPRREELLRRSLETQAACLEQGDVSGYAEATIKFHNHIVEAAENRTLERMLRAVYAQIEALRLRTLYLPMRLRASFDEHQRIMNALSKRDASLSENEARAHIQTTTKEALEILTQAGGVSTDAASRKLE